ncbi:MAG: hypothetical protein R3250_08765 [Melioribacteraceae bacterium]|nr:hypothetical protein [Melioribacteraceae bacterium]
MNDDKQNRREFIISSTRKTILGGLSLVGISLGIRSISADEESICEVNLPCRNCFKLGGCNEDKAHEVKEQIRNNDKQAGRLKGGKNG